MPTWRKVLWVLQLPMAVMRALTVPPPESSAWSRALVVLHPPVCVLFLVWALGGEESAHTTLVLLSFLALSLVVSVVIYFNVHHSRPPVDRASRLALAFVSFAMCVVWIQAVASEIVAILDTMGVVAGANHSLMGLTVLAWGNSLGDLANNVAIAKAGLPMMAVSACVAGPVFNLLVGLGLSLMVLTVRHRNFTHGVAVSLDRFSGVAAVLLVGTLACTLGSAAAHDSFLSKRVGMALVGAYGVFIASALVMMLVV